MKIKQSIFISKDNLEFEVYSKPFKLRLCYLKQQTNRVFLTWFRENPTGL